VTAAAGGPSGHDGTHPDPIVAANPQLADDPLLAEIWRRVQSVEDPCHVLAGYPLTIADLGIVNRVELDGGYVEIGITYTELGCSFAPRILQRLEQELTAVPGVTSMDVVYEPFPPWTPDRMSPRAQELYRQRSVQARTAVAAIPPESIRRLRNPSGEA
jgi:metal-sulfur cluster biosynthetic enzyme